MTVEITNLDALVARVEALDPSKRAIIALAGPPAAGKTTLAAALSARLNAAAPGSAVAVGLDGFHLDDAVLEARGWRPRKGAPHTFDAAGFAHLLGRLAAEEEEVVAPVFDRSLEISRAGALTIPRTAKRIIVEGNYLLLRDAPWAAMAAHYTLTVSVQATAETLRARILGRWREAGLSDAEAAARWDGNDGPNARLVLENATPAMLGFRPATGARKP